MARWPWIRPKPIRELGASFRPFDDTVKDAVDWFRVHGYLN